MRLLLACALAAGCGSYPDVPTPTVATGAWDSAHADQAHTYSYVLAYQGDWLLSDHATTILGDLAYRYDALYANGVLTDEIYADPTRSYETSSTTESDRIVARRHDEVDAGYSEALAYDTSGALVTLTRTFDTGAVQMVSTTYDDPYIHELSCLAGKCDRTIRDGGLEAFTQETIDLGNDGTIDTVIDRTYDYDSELVGEKTTTHGTITSNNTTTRNADRSLATWSHSEPDGIGGVRTFTITYDYGNQN